MPARLLTAITAMALALWAVAGGIGVLRQPVEARALEDLQQRLDEMTRMLAARPMHAQGWVSLAAVRNALAMPQASVDAAFAMSASTGPAEGDVMAQRALLGLLLWETSGAETRARALSDLCGLIVYEPSRLRLVLTAKSETSRAAIRNGLVGQGCPARTLTAIGF